MSFIFFIAHKLKWPELMMKIECRRVVFGEEKVYVLVYVEI